MKKNNIYISDVNVKKYKELLARIEHEKDIAWRKKLVKYNQIINENFDVYDGIDSIYEFNTGAVFFKDYEWEEIKDNKIKDLFNLKKQNSYIYSLPLDNGIILRGSDIYYFFLTFISRFNETKKSDLELWEKNCNDFFDICRESIKSYFINNNYDLRLLLGIIDNLRNIILLMLNVELLMLENENNFLYLDTTNSKINAYYKLIDTYQELTNEILFVRPLGLSIVDETMKLLEQLVDLYNKTMQNVLKTNNQYVFNKGFNRLREIDHYLENYIGCEYAVEELEKKKKVEKFNLIGILYGALELPFIIKNHFNKSEINTGLLFQENGNYFEKQENKKTTKDMIIIGNIDKDLPTIVIDDNLMSGVTIQIAIEQLLTKNINVSAVLGIRHPNINRVSQLNHYNTYLNLELIDNYILGLLTSTPFTKIKESTNNDARFVNELNIYSIQSEVFLKALYINNRFIKASEVDIFLGFSTGSESEKCYFIDFDGVILDSEESALKAINDNESWESFSERLNWDDFLKNERVINNSINQLQRYQYIYTIYIITKTNSLKEQRAKLKFLRDNQIYAPIIFIPPGAYKSDVVKPKENYILLDDNINNVDDWCAKGGKGIYFNENNKSNENGISYIEDIFKL